MTLQTYKTLVAIAELGSFTRVAELLNMTLSTVSMQMKALERGLDVQIFDRTVRPPRLTPLGRDIAEKSRSVVAAQDALIALTRTEATLRGTYRIGFIATASVRLLPGFLSRAKLKAPDARFDVETGLSETLQGKVANGQLDAAVVTLSDTGRSSLTFSVIRSEELVYALPEDFNGKPIDTCMAALPFILFMPHSGIGKLVSNHLATLEHPPRITMILDSVEAIMECVNAGIGFTALPRPDVERYARRQVGIAAMAPQPIGREVCIVTAKGSVADRQVAVIRDLFDSPVSPEQ